MKIAVIGKGNVGSQFANIFGVTPISSRTLEGLPEDADLYIIAVSDAAVAEVTSKLPKLKGVVVHTTGSIDMNVLKGVDCKSYGVLYPFQTISLQRLLPSSSIPLLIEASDDETAKFLESTARNYGFEKIQLTDSEKRRLIHLAGTFCCNFTNAMAAISQKILEKGNIDTDIISPLMEETIAKLKTLPARRAQTGPAARKDYPTMEKHLSLLKQMDMEPEAGIYQDISRYIINNS